MRREAVTKAEQAKGKYQRAFGQLGELKEVLQMAAEADQRKDALIEEIRMSAREAKERNDREREALTKEQEQIEQQRREMRE